MLLFVQPFVTLLLTLLSGLIQLGSQLILSRVIDALPKPHLDHHRHNYRVLLTITAIAVLMSGHMLQVLIWGIRYYIWGETGGFVDSVYFSLASFTTVGASELELSKAHRMVGAIESAVGMLMFGWSTALLVDVIQRAERARLT
jgi:hypothetical protein